MHRLATLPVLGFFACVAAAQTITIPIGSAATEGTTSDVRPWGNGPGLLQQMIYDSANFTGQGVSNPVMITRLRWRPDAGVARTWVNCSYVPATIRLSTCPVDQGSASPSFANNRGLDFSPVYSGLVAWSAGSSTPPGPAPFLVDVPLTVPFYYDPNAGDLNIECDLPVGSFTGTAGLAFDVQSTGSRSCRVASQPYGAPSGVVTLNHGVVVEVTCVPPAGFATAFPYGTGCVSQNGSFYEHFATATTFDLANSSMTMINAGSGYLMLPGFTTYVPPSLTAQSLNLTDDSEVTVPLPSPLAYPGGTTSALTVCSNGFVSVGSGNGTGFTPLPASMLNSPQTGWWNWHDYNPSTVGSGRVKFEVLAGVAYVTWDGVSDFGGTASSGSTMQFQFELTTGHVHFAWGTMSLGGNSYLVGYSAGGPSSDPGSRDISATLPMSFWVSTADVQPLSIAAVTRPISGTNCDLRTANIPAGSSFGAILFGATQWNPGVSLASIGMATCWQWNEGFATTVFLAPGATHNTLVPIPAGFAGTHIFVQSAVYCPGAGLTSLGAIASNGIDLGIHNL